MTEVDVFSEDENVALQGTATQSSTLDDAIAGRANDGKIDKGNQAFSRTTLEPSPWWELKLKEPVPIERLEVHNVSGWHPDVPWTLTVQLLDSNRKVLWHEKLDSTYNVGKSCTALFEPEPPDTGADTHPKMFVAQFLRLELTTTGSTNVNVPPVVENPTPPDDTPVNSPGPTPTPDTP
jgi:hypothetical protein